jgi:hypothetical protein
MPSHNAGVDWLVHPEGFRASVQEDMLRHELVIENGLVRRVLRLTPNAATVALDNVETGETLPRAVGPEARVTLDGQEYAIGGLIGQPIANYLRPEWIDRLQEDPAAYRFSTWAEQPIQARFPWKKHPEWLSRDLPWPPHGRHIVMKFRPPARELAGSGGRDVLNEPLGDASTAGWQTHVSARDARTTLSVGGKFGAILALPDTAAYAEHVWPKGAAVLVVTVAAREDALSNSWGPGIALVCPDRVVSFVARPASGEYEIDSLERGETTAGTFDRAHPARLRAVISHGFVLFAASQDGGVTYQSIGRALLPQGPVRFRIGKVGKDGQGRDFASSSPSGELVRCDVSDVALRVPSAADPTPRADLPDVEVHYEVYDGIPLISKWLVVKNRTAKPIRVNRFVSEEIRLTEPESNVEHVPDRERPDLWVETDYAFGAMDAPHAVAKSVSFDSDPDYPTQVNYNRQTPCLLKCLPPLGPDTLVEANQSFATFRAFELLLDSTERERRGLAQRRMYRTIAPWTAENPLMFHLRDADLNSVRRAIDQAAQSGFEMIIMSFGSGFDFESRDPSYMEKYRLLAAEAKAKGIALGGYSLLASRGAATAADNTQGQPAMYGAMPCLGAKWGIEYLAQLKRFLKVAGLGVLEHDGSYPGDLCAATDHPGHHGLDDSQWVMWHAITDLYRWCRAEGVFLNIPDWYFLNGGNKCGMGYRESNWSLPREEQTIIERQNIYDGTWIKTGSMGWMMVPLTEYQGGGATAIIEPLHEHLDYYESRLANLIGAGVQACYRGPRLYDTEATRALVRKWTDFYKAHRAVLDGDIFHLRRANGSDWDGWLHVAPQGMEKGLAFLYNPLPREITRTVRLPLHYTGLTGHAAMSVDGKPAVRIHLDADATASVQIKIPARGRTYLILCRD